MDRRPPNVDRPLNTFDALSAMPPWQSWQGMATRLGLALLIAALVTRLPDGPFWGPSATDVQRGLLNGLRALWSPITMVLPESMRQASSTPAILSACTGLAILARAEQSIRTAARGSAAPRIGAVLCLTVLGAILLTQAVSTRAFAPLATTYTLAALLALWRLPPALVLSRLLTVFSGTALVALGMMLFSAPLSGGVF